MDKTEKKTCSIQQYEILVEFMEQHVDFALGRCKSKEGRALAHRLWSELAYKLNAVLTAQSSERTEKEWAKYYTDYKARLNNKIRAINASRMKTGGGEGDKIVLSPLDVRLAAVLGHRPGEESTPLQQTRQMPIIGLESQSRSQQENEMNAARLILEEENSHESIHVEYEIEEATSHTTPTHATVPPRSMNQQTLLEMSQQQAQANDRMALAIERMADAILDLSQSIKEYIITKQN